MRPAFTPAARKPCVTRASKPSTNSVLKHAATTAKRYGAPSIRESLGAARLMEGLLAGSWLVSAMRNHLTPGLARRFPAHSPRDRPRGGAHVEAGGFSSAP